MKSKTIIDIPTNRAKVDETTTVFASPEAFNEVPITVKDKKYTYISWGDNNLLPYEIEKKIGKNSVMSQNKLFNLLTCYGRGLEYMDVATMGDKTPRPTTDKEICIWQLRNSVKRFFAEQIVDMKHYFFCVAVFLLSNDRKKILRIVHKDACNIRFEKADKKGRISHVFYADWKRENVDPDSVEVIPLLDTWDPYGDLMARTGRQKDEWGFFEEERGTKFAVVCTMPTVGSHYYQIPPYTAAFRDGWYDMYGLLTAAKKAKLKNGQNIRYHVEISLQFWEERARSKGISMGTPAFEDMKDEFIEDLKKCLSGSENSDKLIWSEFETLVTGQERHNIKINVVDTSKAGNEYNDDVAEASNVLCYDDNVHPNLAGATPGKSQMNNSGSDKRELFTMKQTLETLPHDMMMTLHNTVIWFNGWEEKVVPVVPIIMLTTLDKNTDAKETNMSNNTEQNGNTNENN